jgi:RNA polymerase primary sigma factor
MARRKTDSDTPPKPPARPDPAGENARPEADALPVDEVVDLLEDIDDPLLVEEPDVSVLAQEEPELESLVKEEPLEILDNPSLVMELSEDPVRLYLKEIGGIDLLDTDREFWLASRLDTVRRIDVISRGHPLARKGESRPRSIYRALYDELLTAWTRLEEDSQRLGYPRPDLTAILHEAQMLRETWEMEEPSYLRAYLDNGLWGKDPLWDGVARHAFIVFICLYMLPDDLADHLCKYIEKHDSLPPARPAGLPPAQRYLPASRAGRNPPARPGSPPRHHPRQPAPGSLGRQALYWAG